MKQETHILFFFLALGSLPRGDFLLGGTKSIVFTSCLSPGSGAYGGALNAKVILALPCRWAEGPWLLMTGALFHEFSPF